VIASQKNTCNSFCIRIENFNSFFNQVETSLVFNKSGTNTLQCILGLVRQPFRFVSDLRLVRHSIIKLFLWKKQTFSFYAVECKSCLHDFAKLSQSLRLKKPSMSFFDLAKKWKMKLIILKMCTQSVCEWVH